MLHSLKGNHKIHAGTAAKRVLSAVLCAAFVVSAAGNGTPALAATVNPTCDETYYATLDYYGAIKEGGVVKSYMLNGAASLTDYGEYDKVNNLTDDTKSSVSGNSVTFHFGSKTPNRFYFEGKTKKLYSSIPWDLKVSYKLNGVSAKAEDLGGKTGIIEIDVDATPRKNITDYYKNNFVLIGATAFNADDILSLEAAGAQVQLVGNLRTVLFTALPGETQHISIKVGSNSFKSSGLTFIAAPATLSQLSQITDLKKAKDKTEKSYKSISSSLDTVLDALDNISGSLNGAADGLDELNEARASLSAAQGDIENSLDIALDNFDNLSGALQPLTSHLDTASKAIGDINSNLTALTDTTVSLKKQLAACRQDIGNLQKDGNSLASDLKDLKSSLSSLESTLTYLKNHNALSSMNLISIAGIGTIPTDPSKLQALTSQLDGYYAQADALHTQYHAGAGASDTTDAHFQDYLKSLGDQLYQLWTTEQTAGGKDQLDTSLTQVNQLHDAYHMNYPSADDTGFPTFIAGYLQSKGLPAAQATATAQQLSALWAAEKSVGGKDKMDALIDQANALHVAYVKAGGGNSNPDANFKSYLEKTLSEQLLQVWATGKSLGGTDGMHQMLTQASAANKAISDVNSQLSSVNSLLSGIASPTANVVSSLNALCGTLGADGLTGDVAKAGSNVAAATTAADKAIDQIQALDKTLDSYVPEAQKALADSKKAAANLSSGVQSTDAALRSLKTAVTGPSAKIDASTKKSLESLSKALRGSTKGLGETGNIRNSKKTITDLIDDEWNSHTGGDNNVLLMDPNATPVSMTSSENQAPQSVQMILRTEEIKEDSGKKNEQAAKAAKSTSFWERVGNMFTGIWNSFTGLFHH